MLCKAQRKLGKTVIIVTHDNDIASRTDRIIRIADGMIIEDIDNRHHE